MEDQDALRFLWWSDNYTQPPDVYVMEVPFFGATSSPCVANYDQLYNYITVNNLLSRHKSGFRSLHSTVSALLEVTDSWSLNIDRGLVNAVIFLDLKKAFDTMDHNILLSKLQFYGINKWFSSYLKRRTQTCLVNCNKSSERLNRYPLRNILAYILIKI